MLTSQPNNTSHLLKARLFKATILGALILIIPGAIFGEFITSLKYILSWGSGGHEAEMNAAALYWAALFAIAGAFIGAIIATLYHFGGKEPDR